MAFDKVHCEIGRSATGAGYSSKWTASRRRPWYNFGVMRITLNGDPREFPAELTLQELLDTLAIPSGRVACEVNLKIVRRAQYPGTPIKEGDTVEIIQAIGGG